jgi:hypothetical protein
MIEQAVQIGVPIGILLATIALAIVTARLFGATATVAKETGELAKSTAKLVAATAALAEQSASANLLADKHHQESLLPVLVARSVAASTYATGSQLFYHVVIEVRNVGLGTAIDVRFMNLTMDGSISPPAAELQRVIEAIAPSETLTLDKMVPVERFLGGRGNGMNVPVTFGMIYCSMFGATGTLTVESTDPRDIRNAITRPAAVGRALPVPEE